MKLIGLAGLKGVGKDTVTAMILDDHQGIQRAFAGPLKRAISEMFLIPMTTLEDPVLKELHDPRWGKSPRQLMQELGTEFVRDRVRCDAWVQRLALEMAQVMEQATARGATPPSLFLVSDVRFENEARWIRGNGGLVVHIERPGHLNGDGHRSELGVKVHMGDRIIVNDGSLEDLRAKVRKAMGVER